mmetsp:Transcript_9067/g.16504  ORF Transcript_9067/g.16504 Transcript_9067/m.16504 type:complete len:82 (-) Transcript_9067:284-529(-)
MIRGSTLGSDEGYPRDGPKDEEENEDEENRDNVGTVLGFGEFRVIGTKWTHVRCRRASQLVRWECQESRRPVNVNVKTAFQ